MEIRIAKKEDMEKVFALRCEVFVAEQSVPPEIELDEYDASALHIIAEQCGVAIGCARVIFTENEAHIGRLAVKKSERGRGVGSGLCRFIISHCKEKGIFDIWLNSQLHAYGFYEKLGFKPQGERFFEAGIEHVKMVWQSTEIKKRQE